MLTFRSCFGQSHVYRSFAFRLGPFLLGAHFVLRECVTHVLPPAVVVWATAVHKRICSPPPCTSVFVSTCLSACASEGARKKLLPTLMASKQGSPDYRSKMQWRRVSGSSTTSFSAPRSDEEVMQSIALKYRLSCSDVKGVIADYLDESVRNMGSSPRVFLCGRIKLTKRFCPAKPRRVGQGRGAMKKHTIFWQREAHYQLKMAAKPRLWRLANPRPAIPLGDADVPCPSGPQKSSGAATDSDGDATVTMSPYRPSTEDC